jgi:hypothetical protein
LDKRIPQLVIALALLAPPFAHAGVVQTITARAEGKVTLEKGRLTLDGKPVTWDDVLFFMLDGPRRTPPRPQAITFKNGEVWAVELLGLADRHLEVRSDLFDKRKINLDLVAALDLTPRPAPLSGLKPNTLYRDKGEPVPGTLLVIADDKLSLDSPLGVLHLPRAGLTRYVLDPRTAPVPPDAELDEVTLVEGSVLRGKLRPSVDGLELEHALLGRLTIPAAAVRSVVRYRPSVTHLAELAPQSVQTAPLLGAGDAPPRIQVQRGSAWDGEGGRSIKAVRIEPKTTVRYALPKRPGRKLRAVLEGVEEARGDVKVRIRIDDRVVFDEEWKAGDKPRALTLDLPDGDELIFEVDFGARLRFPCGVLLGDPHVIATKP